jgi:hypothetical protein
VFWGNKKKWANKIHEAGGCFIFLDDTFTFWYGRPCTRDYQAPITGLHSPILLLFLQNSTDYIMLAQSCKFVVNCCFIGLTHPAACTECVCLWLFEMSTGPPFYPIYSKRVPIGWVWAEDFNDMFKIPWEWPRKKLETLPKKTITTSGDHPTRPPPGFDSYLIDLTRVVQKLCFLHPPARGNKIV